MNGRSVETTFFWSIENYSYNWHKFGEYLRSPCFSAYDPENTSWCIVLYPRGERYVSRSYISLFLARNPTDEGQENVSVKYELSILAADGSLIHSETKKETFENNDISGFEEFLMMDSFYEDVLTVRCRLWKGDGKTQESDPIYAETHIRVENRYFAHRVENFSTLEPNHKQTVEEMSLDRRPGIELSSNLYFTNDSRCEGEMTVEIEPSDGTLILCKHKVSLYDASGNLIECGKSDNRFDVEKKDIQKLPLLLTRQFILNKKSEYLHGDMLSLLYECTFSNGMVSEIIKDFSSKPVKQVGIKQASDWYECMDRRIKIELTDENRPFTGTGQITLEVRVENFSTASEVTPVFHYEVLEPLLYKIGVFAGDTDGWLAVFPEVRIFQKAKDLYFHPKHLWWTASIIDTEGHSRFPQYFEKYPEIKDDQANDLREAKYLEKSFILDRADDLLSENTLLLRCDIQFDIDVIQEVWTNNIDKFNDFDFVSFVRNIPYEICMDLNSRYTFPVYNLTSQYLNFPMYYRFGSHDILRSINSEPKTDISEFEKVLTSKVADTTLFSRSINSESTEDSDDNMEDIWILDTDSDRFLLNLTRRAGNLGRLLIAASPVIRQCINTPMREQGEKRIDLSTVDSDIMKMVLYFLESGRLPKCKFHELVGIYEFSHLYLMENLQLRSANSLVEGCDDISLLEEIESIANLNSDGYLLKLLEKRRRELEHFRGELETKEHGNPDAMEDRPGSDCYI